MRLVLTPIERDTLQTWLYMVDGYLVTSWKTDGSVEVARDFLFDDPNNDLVEWARTSMNSRISADEMTMCWWLLKMDNVNIKQKDIPADYKSPWIIILKEWRDTIPPAFVRVSQVQRNLNSSHEISDKTGKVIYLMPAGDWLAFQFDLFNKALSILEA